MTKKSLKLQPTTPTRPPVDALQYEKLALSAFDLCDRSLTQLDTLITLASSIHRNPALTRDERQRRQKLIELLVDTAEQYQQELECDRELFQVIALDAKGVPHSRITARHAANLLAEAAQKGGASQEATANGKRGKNVVREKRRCIGSGLDAAAARRASLSHKDKGKGSQGPRRAA